MRTLVLTVPADDAEAAADRLWTGGARAIEERATPGATELRTVLGSDDEVSRTRLGAIPATWNLSFVDPEPEPAETWRAHAEPIRVRTDLVIQPAWLGVAPDPGITHVLIEPASAFGLGDHPTTRLAAAAAWRLVRPGDRVLDVGCGSGVLAIVAARRGASSVVAIDVADAAREATDDNARRNGVGETVRAATTSLADVAGCFDVVLANILAPTLVAMSDDLRRVTAPSGSLVISGILAERHDHVLDALRPMRVAATEELDGWVAVELAGSAAE